MVSFGEPLRMLQNYISKRALVKSMLPIVLLDHVSAMQSAQNSTVGIWRSIIGLEIYHKVRFLYFILIGCLALETWVSGFLQLLFNSYPICSSCNNKMSTLTVALLIMRLGYQRHFLIFSGISYSLYWTCNRRRWKSKDDCPSE